MSWVPVPGYGAGNYSFEGNLAAYVDRTILPGKKYYGDWDPEGILTTIPAIGSGIFGMLAGQLLLNKQITPLKKALALLIFGIVAMDVALIWHPWFPINKSLWSSSFVVLTAGIAALVLGMCVLIADVWGDRHLLWPFVVVGRNLLVAYLIIVCVPLASISQRLVGGDIAQALGNAALFASAIVEILFVWLILYWLFARRIFVKF